MSNDKNNNTPKPQPVQPRDYCIIFTLGMILFAGSMLFADARSRQTDRMENMLASIQLQLNPVNVSEEKPACKTCAQKAAAKKAASQSPFTSPLSKPIQSGFIAVPQRVQSAIPYPMPDEMFSPPKPEAFTHDPESIPAGDANDPADRP